MKKQISIIGYGRFGRLAARYLKTYCTVSVSDIRKIRKPGPGVNVVSLKAAAKADVVILAVPIRHVQAVLHAIVPWLKPNAIVCDVCSVKEQPVRWMKNILPKHISIVGTHPLFGPDSGSRTLRGRTIILSPVRIPAKHLRTITRHLTRAGMRVVQMSPAEHDKLMAKTLFLTQFIGHGLLRLPIAHTAITTQNFEMLSHIVSATGNDSMELFADMFRYNRFATNVPRNILRRFTILSRALSK